MTKPTIVTSSPATSIEKLDRNLSDVFGTDPMAVQTAPLYAPPMVVDADMQPDQQVEADADFARSNLYGLVQSGQEALQYAIDLAKQSDSPRAFEVVGTLLKNMADINMQLLDAQEKRRKLRPQKVPAEEQSAKVVNNNSIVFNGTTAQLNEMLRNMRKD